MNILEILQGEDTKIGYLLALICLAMVIDFFSGVISALINKEIVFQSQRGINGILRKIASVVLLIFFIPLAGLIPANAGRMLLYVLYGGYLLMEIQSVLENYEKMGVSTKVFQNFLEVLGKWFRERK